MLNQQGESSHLYREGAGTSEVKLVGESFMVRDRQQIQVFSIAFKFLDLIVPNYSRIIKNNYDLSGSAT